MHRVRTAGIILAVVGTAGYLVGITTSYPGRAFTVTLVMLGTTLVAIRSLEDHTGMNE